MMKKIGVSSIYIAAVIFIVGALVSPLVFVALLDIFSFSDFGMQQESLTFKILNFTGIIFAAIVGIYLFSLFAKKRYMLADGGGIAKRMSIYGGTLLLIMLVTELIKNVSLEANIISILTYLVLFFVLFYFSISLEKKIPPTQAFPEDNGAVLVQRNYRKFIQWLIIAIAPILVVAIFVFDSGALKYYKDMLSSRELKGLTDGFSKFNYIHKSKDMYSLAPEKIDSLGTDPASAYFLRSKDPIDLVELEKKIRIEPQTDFIKQQVSEREVALRPAAPLAPGSLVKFALSSGENGDNYDYSWAYQVKYALKMIHSIPRDMATNVPLDSGIEVTFSHDNFIDYEKYFEITPRVDGRFEKHGRTLVYVPLSPLAPRTVYSVKVKSGLPVENSQERLEGDVVFAFETASEQDDADQWGGPYERMIETTTQHPPVFQIYPENAPENIEAELFKFPSWESFLESSKKRDSVPWWSYSRENFVLDVGGLKKIGSFNLEKKESGGGSFLMLPEELSPGFYLAQFLQNGENRQVWIQVSDISAYYNVTKTDTIFWINGTKNGTPEDGVSIELIGAKDDYETGMDGMAVFATPSEIIAQAEGDNRDKTMYFKVSKGEHMLILPVTAALKYYWWSTPPAADEYWNYLYTDRPRYMTSDTIKFFGLLKPREGGKTGEKITVSLYKEGYMDYGYNPVEINNQEISVDEAGIFRGEIKLDNMLPDYYNLQMKIGDRVVKNKYLTIQSYVKPAFELSIVPDKKAAFAGEEVKFDIKANFFEGTPVPDLELKISTPKDGEKFLKTDDKGMATISHVLDYYDCNTEYGCWPDYQRFAVEPKNSELAEITAEANIRIYGPRVYAGSKVSYPEKGKAQIRIESKFVDIQKISEDYGYGADRGMQPAPGSKIEGEVTRIIHVKEESGTGYDFINKKRYTNYRYNTIKEKVRDFSGNADAQGVFILDQAVDPENSYEVSYRVYDSEGRFDKYRESIYYFNGRDVFSYSRWDYGYYSLSLNDKSFSVGEEVVANFKKNDETMPDKEHSYLYLKLQNGLVDHELSGRSEYRFNFKKENIPNVNLTGVYFNGVTYFEAGSYNDSVNYDYKDSELELDIRTDKESYLPGEEVVLDVQAKRKDGELVSATVNLNLVDEAYYALFEDVASPLESLYSAVGAGNLFSERTHSNLGNVSGMAEKGGCFLAGTPILMAGGGEKNIEDIKKGDKILTFSDPADRTLEEGEVTETWKHTVPEYLVINGSLRVTPEHQIFSKGRFIDAGLLEVGDWMLGKDGSKVVIRSIEFQSGAITVYNFRVDPQHSFFAGGVYVHNEEKGGGPREFFTDAAVFETLKTDSAGKGSIRFTLPDNITSWRVTSQAISGDLSAGLKISKIPVSLPVFADVTVGNEYLAEDEPVVRMRAFGSSLSGNDDVKFFLSVASLGIQRTKDILAKAFQSAYYQLPKLNVGKHEITYELETSKGDDSIKLPIDVISSRMEKYSSKYEILKTDTRIKPVNDLPITLTFSDKGRSMLFPLVQDLSWQWGDRVDQKYAKNESRRILKEFFSQDSLESHFNPFEYQQKEGGISLLPYSSEDLELSARISASGAEGFDKNALAQYFFNKAESKESSEEEISLALFGLAEMKKPVLARIENWLRRDDLSVKDKLYMAQALNDLGSAERSLSVYGEVMEKYAQTKGQYIIIKASDDVDEVFHLTSLGAALAASLGAGEAEGMMKYVSDSQDLYSRYKNSENLYGLEKLNYVRHSLANLNPKPVKISYSLSGKEGEIDLEKQRSYSIMIASNDAKNISFTRVDGDAGINISYRESFNIGEARRDGDVGVRREYYVNGKRTNEFSESDMIEVRLYPSFSKDSIAGEYLLADILPSGLAPMTRFSSSFEVGGGECSYRHPYGAEGQIVKYDINKYWRNDYCGDDYIYYFARVKNKGTYKAEPAVIQSFANPSSINYSDEEGIVIR